MQTTRRQSLIVNLLVSVSVTALFLGALEGLARLFEERPATRPAATERRTWQASWRDDFYTVLTPGHGWPFDGEFNRDGLRDVTHPFSKAPRSLRLVFLGDSVTAGVDLAPDEAFPRVLGELLDEAGRNTEVLNVALSGWSTRQERIAYERLVRRYRPDRVVVAVCLNDIDELQNNLARPPRWLAALHERSALVRRLVNARRREIESTTLLFSQASSPEVREAFQRFFAELRSLRSAVKADGATLSVLVFPYRFQLEPGAPLPSVQEAIASFCSAESIPLIDALPFLRPGGPALFSDGNHLNAQGSRVVAVALRDSALTASGPSFGETLDAFRAHCQDAPACLDEALADREPAVREAAAWRIARLTAPTGRTLTLLAERAVQDPDWAVRARAVRGLDSLSAAPAAKPALAAALGDREEAVRWATIRALERAGLHPPEDLPLLVSALASEDPFVRDFAASTLGNWGEDAREAAATLAEAARRDDESGLIATRALAKIGPAAEAALPSLVASLQSDDARRREKTAVAIGRMRAGARAAVAPLTSCLADPAESVRVACARALQGIGPAAAPASAGLAKCLGDPAESVRLACAEALGALASRARSVAQRLLESLDDPSESVRHAAARSLAAIGSLSDALAHLTRSLASPDAGRRLSAAATLGELGPAAAPAVASLALGLGDVAPEVRAECARTLGRIGREARPAVPKLVACLDDPEGRVRLLAVRALGWVGERDAAAAVRMRLKDQDPRVGREARKALARLAGDLTARSAASEGD